MATKSIPIKQDLFSFITSRGIEPISYQDKENSFIKHPDISKSQFLKYQTTAKNSKSKVEFKSISNYLELREINPALFDLSTNIDRIGTLTQDTFKGIEPLKKETEIQVWDYLFAELVHQKSPRNRKALTQVIKTNFIASSSRKDVELSQLVKRKILVPLHIIELIKLNFKDCSRELIGVNEIGVIEFRKVEQEVCCYIPGEVSHIENVLAREYKEKHTRDLLRTEITTESETETEIENLTDTSTTTRNELNTEIERTLEEERSSNYGGSLSVSAKWGTANIDANAYADFSNSNSSSQSNSVAQNFAQEVTRKAVEKIVRKTKQKRTSKILKEFETNNRHGFDNREGDEHVTGVYRWVDQIFTNRLVNFGKRLVYKFTIPHPAEFYKMAINFKSKKENSESKSPNEPPRKLSDFGINSFADITEEHETKVNEAAAYYGVSVKFPEMEKIVPFSLNFSSLGYKSQTQNTPSHSQPIEDGFGCVAISGRVYVNYKGNRTKNGKVVSWFHYDNFKDGKDGYYCSGSKDCDTYFDVSNGFNANPIQGSLNCYYRYQEVGSLSGSFNLRLRITAQRLEEWQKEVFNQLNNAYQQKLSEYEYKQQEIEDQQALEQEESNNNTSNNPLDNRIIEQRELKRACIEMMMKPYCKKLGRDFTDERSCGEYQVAQTMQTPEFAEYIKYVAFFERAFDWDIMSYVFHPYYWADCKNWVELIQTKNADRIFQAFLQAGIAEVVVPVKCEMSLAVAYYMETGDIMNPGDLVPEDLGDYYVSLAKEMQDCQEEVVVEGTWDSRVPTSLTILQKDSALIEESGLPCCERIVENGYENSLKAGDGKYKLLEAKKSE